MALIQNARNGRSDSKEFPFTTNAGTAQKSRVAASGLFEKRRASDHMAIAAITENRCVRQMKRDFAHVAEPGQERRENPSVQRRMRVPAHVHHLAAEHLSGVHRMQRFDLGMLRLRKIENVVALNSLVEKRQAQRENQREDGESSPYHWTGTPGWSVHTSVPDRSPRISASCSGRPLSAGKVPKCRGITLRTLSIRQASAASFGPMV